MVASTRRVVSGDQTPSLDEARREFDKRSGIVIMRLQTANTYSARLPGLPAGHSFFNARDCTAEQVICQTRLTYNRGYITLMSDDSSL